MYGLVLARYSKFPHVKTRGMSGIGQLIAFTSEEVCGCFFFVGCWMLIICVLFGRVIIRLPRLLTG